MLEIMNTIWGSRNASEDLENRPWFVCSIHHLYMLVSVQFKQNRQTMDPVLWKVLF